VAVRLQSLYRRNIGFESPEGMDVPFLCLLWVVLVTASVTDRSLVQRNLTVWMCLTVCDLEKSTMRWPRSESGYCATGNKKHYYSHHHQDNFSALCFPILFLLIKPFRQLYIKCSHMRDNIAISPGDSVVRAKEQNIQQLFLFTP
jgi:hypothetical protein